MTMPSSQQQAIMSRYQPTGDAQLNTTIACDPHGFESISAAALEEVSYERPSFNWPNPSLNLSNVFSIYSMAVDVLKKTGFSREASSLSLILKRATPVHKDLPDLLWHFLDFEPTPAVDPALLTTLREKAQELGIDPEVIGFVPKKSLRNPLAHRCKNLKDEWSWLVEHASVVSPFGKSAASEMAPHFMRELAALWLPQLGSPLAGTPDDPSIGNLAWFREHFPMGWAEIDEMQDTSVINLALTQDFESILTVAFFTIANLVDQGFADLDEARRWTFDHRTAVGIYGGAALTMPAEDYFKLELMPHFLGAPPKTLTSNAHSPLVNYLTARDPTLLAGSPECALWMAYQAIDPKGSSACFSVLSDAETNPEVQQLIRKSQVLASAFNARLERFSLQTAYSLGLWPSEVAPSALLKNSGPRL